jgi:hypothetical protein
MLAQQKILAQGPTYAQWHVAVHVQQDEQTINNVAAHLEMFE